MAALDVWLVLHLAQSIGAVLTQARLAAIPALAVVGCAAMTGAALLLSWLLLGDLLDSLRRNRREPGHKN